MPVQTQIQVRRGTASSWTSTNPTLAAGEIGFETDTGKIKVGNGSSTWSALNYVGAANAIQYVYNATAGQTSFSGADSNGLTLSYTVGAEQVYVNGVLQVRTSDYTATNGTSVTLTTATIASDVVTIVAFGTFDIANTYTQAQANATFPLNTSSFFAGKNKIINGDFNIWQRGTSFTINNSSGFTADRWLGDVLSNSTISQQTFTPGTAPVAGYEGQYFLRMAVTSGSGAAQIEQRIEDVRTLAGQTATLSFWAKSASASTIDPLVRQYFGSGGSANVNISLTQIATTTSWTRYSATFTLGSMSGKTIGSNSYLLIRLAFPSSGTFTTDIWGVQLEAGSVATAFTTATGTIQGELAACQRYYFRYASSQYLGAGHMQSTTAADVYIKTPVTMRSAPTYAAASGTSYFQVATSAATTAYSTIGNFYGAGTDGVLGRVTVSGFTAGQGCVLVLNNASAWVEGSAEL